MQLSLRFALECCVREWVGGSSRAAASAAAVVCAEYRDLFGAHCGIARCRARTGGAVGPAFRPEHGAERVHPGIPDPERRALAVRRCGAERRVRADVHRACRRRARTGRGVLVAWRPRSCCSSTMVLTAVVVAVHGAGAADRAALPGQAHHRRDDRSRDPAEPRAVPDRVDPRHQRADRRHPAGLRPLHGPGAQPGRVERRDHDLHGRGAAADQHLRRRDLRLRGRRTDRHDRAAGHGAADAAAGRLPLCLGVRLAR